MSDPFTGEIRFMANNYAPRGWAKCEGQLLPISQNTVLFSLLGTRYGGDGRTSFGLPDLRGRAPVHQGRGPGLSNVRIGDAFGVEQVVLTEIELPAHSHSLEATSNAQDRGAPNGAVPATASANVYAADGRNVVMASPSIGSTGGGHGHDNMMPSLVLNVVLCLVGTRPMPN